MMARQVLLLALGLGFASTTLGAADAIADLEKWVIRNGGMIKTRSGINKDGVRGLFAKESVAGGQYLATITGASIINAGSINGAFLTPALIVLKELMNPNSRFLPYLKSMPGRSEVVNSCNMDPKYWEMYESDYWVKFVKSWQDYFEVALRGEANGDLEWTIPEMLGNVTGKITVDDLKYACALSSTRYVATDKRQRLIMAPIYDLANHKRNCPHTISPYDEQNEFHILAGHDVVAGDEICYSYGPMRDDYSVAHYGFVPDLEDPPRLLQVDHHQFKAETTHQNLGEEPFSGTPEEIRAELQRHQLTLTILEGNDRGNAGQPKPPKGKDYVFDMMLELQGRRRNSLRYEIKRLSDLLAKPEL